MQFELSLLVSSLLGISDVGARPAEEHPRPAVPAVGAAATKPSGPSMSRGIAPPYTEVPGDREFNGELIVRPKQHLTRSQRAHWR